MQTVTINKKVKSLSDPFRIYPIGDVHLGELGCDLFAAKELIETASKDDQGIVLVMGDMGEFIGPQDRRWDPKVVAEDMTIRELSNWGLVLSRVITKLLWPVKDKLIGYIPGNHEESYRKKFNTDVAYEICADLGCPLLSYLNLIAIEFEARKKAATLEILATHGRSCAATETGRQAAMAKLAGITTAQLVLMGHLHAMRERRINRLGSAGDLVEQVVVMTGTYLQTYRNGPSGYGEERAYEPMPVGSPVIEIIPETGEINVSWFRY